MWQRHLSKSGAAQGTMNNKWNPRQGLAFIGNEWVRIHCQATVRLFWYKPPGTGRKDVAALDPHVRCCGAGGSSGYIAIISVYRKAF